MRFAFAPYTRRLYSVPMPIAYSCPHCGKQYSVAEQYAGQTGPCASCGKPITIPMPAGMAGYAYAPKPGRGGGGVVAIALLSLCGMGGIWGIGMFFVLLLRDVQYPIRERR